MPTIHRLAPALAALPLLFGLSACGGSVERTFGLTRDAPDEFTVTTRAPLSMPPDYSLRPPQPGAQRPQELTSQQAAEAALAPDTALAGTAGSATPGQEALVQQAGPAAPGDIRGRVDAEASNDHPSQGLTDRLMFWHDEAPAGTVLDANRESQRLRQNAALGQPPTAGDTAIIQQQKKTSLFGLF